MQQMRSLVMFACSLVVAWLGWQGGWMLAVYAGYGELWLLGSLCLVFAGLTVLESLFSRFAHHRDA